MQRHSSLIAFAVLASFCQAGFAQSSTFTTSSAGNWGPIVAPDSIAAGFGSSLTNQTYSSFSLPLTTDLGGVIVQVTDSSKTSAAASLYMASAGQVNYLVPTGAAVGLGSTVVTSRSGTVTNGTVLISNVAPAIFAANGNGQGPAAAEVFYYPAIGSSSYAYTFVGGASSYGTSPITLSPSTTQVFVVLYGTGIRHHSLNPVKATIGGTLVPVAYAGAVSSDPGLDQINLGPLPQSLAGTGRGDVPVVVTVDGAPANTVTVNIQ